MYKIVVNESLVKRFSTKDEITSWLLEGLAGTDGAEREHYVNMLLDLKQGKTTLHYN